MGAATATDTCTGDADTITGGTGAAATTSIAIIAADKLSLDSLSSSHCPDDTRMQRRERVAPTRRGRFSVIMQMIDSAGAQPSPISTAIRIRSE